MSENALINKYRPADWDQVVGHEAPIRALVRSLKSASCPHSFLFTGPSGVGKTTMARILAKELLADITEIDAASNNGVDAMRELVEFSQHTSFNESGRRLMIIDEAHALSKAAWQAALKLLEEPPNHCFLALCTTELAKVPETIVTRCFHVPLRPVPNDELEALLDVVIGCEQFEVTNDVRALVLQASSGSPRQALSILQAVHAEKTRDDAKRVISLVEASEPLIELLQHLLSGKRSWKQVQSMLSKIESESFEEASILAGRYIAGAMLRANNDAEAQRAWQLLEALVFPAETYDKKIAFFAAVGRILWGG